ncbi:MAG: hypothetical protein K8R35_00040 [Bacteroidales bacterium]|nr:hypothetical protein [Bacteroidales bacterium]
MIRTKKIIILLLTGILVFSQNICSQNILNSQNHSQQQFIARIKQFNEFIDRFNYKTDFNGDRVDSAFMVKYPRERYLEHLFDRENLSGPDSLLVEKFIDHVTGNDLYTYKYSDNIIAAARTKVLSGEKSETITIFLNQEIVGDDMVKWVILDVEGSVLNFMEEDTTHIRFISPSSNETNFINLKRAMEDSVHLQDYAHINYRYDPLSVFFYCLNKNTIEIEHVEKLSYYIIDIPGWCFKIEEFNRPGYNSGWLISDLFESDLNLREFLDYITLSF